MRIKLLVVLVLLLLAMADVSHAGGRCGRWGGGWRRLGRRMGAAVGALARPWLGWMGAGDHPLESPTLLPLYRPSMLSSPGACMRRPRMTYSAPALYRAQTRLARLANIRDR